MLGNEIGDFCPAIAVRRGPTYGTRDATAVRLGQVNIHRQHWRGYVPNAGFEESPKTIDVSASFHELETTTKAERGQISI